MGLKKSCVHQNQGMDLGGGITAPRVKNKNIMKKPP
jgi:hypothetical protein